MDYPFESDGCSVVADLDVGMRLACLAHDWEYWIGGTRQERRDADDAFFRAITKRSRYRWLAPFRWFGVRIGGARWINWRRFGLKPRRWGYGWKYPRCKAPTPDISAFPSESGTKEYERLRWKITGMRRVKARVRKRYERPTFPIAGDQ